MLPTGPVLQGNHLYVRKNRDGGDRGNAPECEGWTSRVTTKGRKERNRERRQTAVKNTFGQSKNPREKTKQLRGREE